MGKIVVTAEVNNYETSQADPTDPWDRADTGGEITSVIAYLDTRPDTYYGVSAAAHLDAKEGDTVFAVVVDYASGDTFGHDRCNAKVLDVFLTEAEAEALVDAAEAESTNDRYGFEHNGKDYSRCWVGYFESLNSITIWSCTVRANPADPFRKRGTGRYSRRTGS